MPEPEKAEKAEKEDAEALRAEVRALKKQLQEAQELGDKQLNDAEEAKFLQEAAEEAQRKAYEGVNAIDWPQGFCRKDIGWRAIGRRS